MERRQNDVNMDISNTVAMHCTKEGMAYLFTFYKFFCNLYSQHYALPQKLCLKSFLIYVIFLYDVQCITTIFSGKFYRTCSQSLKRNEIHLDGREITVSCSNLSLKSCLNCLTDILRLCNTISYLSNVKKRYTFSVTNLVTHYLLTRSRYLVRVISFLFLSRRPSMYDPPMSMRTTGKPKPMAITIMTNSENFSVSGLP